MISDLSSVLRTHAEKYPLMQPCDAVKLIYQNEFAGGHLIRSPQESLERILREYAAIEVCPSDRPCEYIGSGLFRVHLDRMDPGRFSPERLNDAFVATAQTHRGSMPSFLEKLELLEDLRGLFSFTRTELEYYITAYRTEGCPIVSHSEVYRRAYRPAYRICRGDLIRELLN